jgi:hypothetical protein
MPEEPAIHLQRGTLGTVSFAGSIWPARTPDFIERNRKVR